MKIHNLVRGAIGRINPNITGVLYRSKGYELEGTQQVPLYEDPVSILLQVQDAKGDTLHHDHYVSEQNEHKIVYASEQLYGIDRVRGVGGDLLEFMGRRWLVVQRLEAWETSGWSRVLVSAQLDKPEVDEGEIIIYAE